MYLIRLLLAALLLLGTAGCAQVPPAPRATEHGASLVLTPRFDRGAYGTQTIVAAYAKQDIQHLILKLFWMEGQKETAVTGTSGAPVELDLTRAELDSPITIKSLQAARTYRVRAYAYKAMGTAEADRISTTDAGSYKDVTVTNDDAPTVSPFVVKLVPKPFGATARVTVIASGSISFGSVLFSLSGPNSDIEPFATVSLTPDQLPNTLTFSNLQGNSTYYFDAQALDANGFFILGANSRVTLVVGNDTVVAPSSMVLTVPVYQ